MRAMLIGVLMLAGCVTVEIRSETTLMAEMQALEAARGTAIRDRDEAALRRIYAADFEGLTMTGARVTREELLAAFTQGRGAINGASSEITSVRNEGDVAIVTGRVRINTSTSQFLHVFRRAGDRWEMIAGASSPSPET